MEKVVVRPYFKNFTMNQSLHDPKRPSLHCRCGDSNPTQETMSLNVINRSTGVVAKFDIIPKICNYKGLHEGHHFIPMTMQVHNTPEHDMHRFIKECACLFHDKLSRGHLFMSFRNQFFNQICY